MKPTADKHDHLSTAHLSTDLKAQTIRSTGITFVAQGLKFILQLISIAVLARLLSPADFGLVAMVTIMTGLLSKFMDGGLSMATIQRQEITQGQISNLFWINVGLGLALTLLTIAVAPALSWVYDESRLTLIGAALSISFLIGGLTVQHTALLKRQMQFRALARIDVISMASGILAGIASAWAGLGYWSLVILTLGTTVVHAGIVWTASAWRPSAPKRGTGVRPLLNFGINLTGANFIGYLASNLTPFVVGLVGGPQQLGFYNRANTLTSIPGSQILPPVMNVAQPALCRVVDEPERFRRGALSLMRKVVLVALFITVSMIVMADWIIEIFLGAGWADAALFFRLLAIFAIVEPLASVLAMMLIAAGRADVLLKSKVISLAAIIVSCLVGLHWGVVGVIAAYAISGLLIRTPIFIWFACRCLPFSQSDIYRSLAPFFFIAMSVLGIVSLMRYMLEVSAPLVNIFITSLLVGAFYFSSLYFFLETRKDAAEIIVTLKSYLRKTRQNDTR
ncbi:lipopolysaccharide biosynthesis protein [Lamprobacter modestohalophilus]|uniref:lipopolysaccharide biosynthesis protein n=1 Tax=Lamprobacter modestohalophilus TaxID=1064514 RepID=UPI002ADEBBFA|nr:lipopolysaccharide biosynthesis protein [Lamprobacter modestohalophilus]MEA1049005.1 lipopolysaccharide biosynthesis protein [Lamprobacter modestohalophilus]